MEKIEVGEVFDIIAGMVRECDKIWTIITLAELQSPCWICSLEFWHWIGSNVVKLILAV